MTEDVKNRATDTPLRDFGLRLLQPREGYRFSVDSLLLVDFMVPKRGARVLDIGAGCGVIGLCILKRFSKAHVTFIEIQDQLFELLVENIKKNGLEECAKAIQGDFTDFRRLFPPGQFDLVVSNPPYRTPESGRLCIEAQEALSRHEITLGLETLLRGVRHVLRPGGHFYIIYPADRGGVLMAQLIGHGLEPKRFQPVYPKPGKEARMCMVDCVKDGRPGGLHILPPIYVKVERE